MRSQNLVFTALLAFLPTLVPAFQPLFDTSISYNVTSYKVIAADLDNDGDADLSTVWSNVGVLKNDSNGVFTVKNFYGSLIGYNSIFVADLDGDLDQDLVTTSKRD